MAKKNNRSNGNNNANSNTTVSNNNVQENTMQTFNAEQVQEMIQSAVAQSQGQVQPIQSTSSILEGYADEASQGLKTKTLKESEVARIKKQINKAVELVNASAYLANKDATTDAQKLAIKHETESSILSIKEQFKSELQSAKLNFEEVMPAVGITVAEKAGDLIAPVSKTVLRSAGAFWNRIK